MARNSLSEYRAGKCVHPVRLIAAYKHLIHHHATSPVDRVVLLNMTKAFTCDNCQKHCNKGRKSCPSCHMPKGGWKCKWCDAMHEKSHEYCGQCKWKEWQAECGNVQNDNWKQDVASPKADTDDDGSEEQAPKSDAQQKHDKSSKKNNRWSSPKDNSYDVDEVAQTDEYQMLTCIISAKKAP